MKRHIHRYVFCGVLLVACFTLLFAMTSYSIKTKLGEVIEQSDSPSLQVIYDQSLKDYLAAEAASGSGSTSSTSSASFSPGFSESASDSDYSAGGSGWIEVSRTGTYTITLSGNLTTAIANGRLKATVTATGTYRVRATSAGASGDSTKTIQIGTSGGLSGYYRNVTDGNGDSGTVSFSNAQLSSGTVTSTSIVVTVYTRARAKWAGGNIFSWKYSYVDVAYTLTNVTITFGVNNLTATFAPNNASYGSVSASSVTMSSFTATASSTATANTNYYFSGWNNGTATRAVTTAQLYTLNANPSLTANFAAINIPIGTYTYNGSAQGPTATGVDGYTFTYAYAGTANDGTTYSASSAPINAGSYTVTATMKRTSTGEEVGKSSAKAFTIGKATPVVTPIARALYYGQSLSVVSPNGTAANNVNSSLSVAGQYRWRDPARIPSLNTAAYEAYFTPTDTNNYVANEVNYNVNVTANRYYTIAAVDFYSSAGVESHTESRNTVAFNDTLTIPINSNHSAQVSVVATPYTAGNYVFAGWKKNGVYQSLSTTYTYTMQNETSAEYGAELVAIFLKIDVSGLEYLGSNTYRYQKPFSGDADAFTFRYSLNLTSYNLVNTGLSYVGGGGFPIAVGQKTATFTIINTALGNGTVLSGTINFVITEGVVSYEVYNSRSIGYNQVTGWGESIYFRLTVPSAAANTIQYYMYKIEGQSDWHIVENVFDSETAPLPIAPQINQPGCPVLFKAGAAATGESKVVKYLFKAISSDYGTTVDAPPGHKSVATSASPATCKLDKVSPSLSVRVMNGAADYNGSWINTNITFVFTVTYGGSGAQILYRNNASSPFTDTNSGPVLNYGDSATITSNKTFSWTVTEEQMSKGYYFRLITGTNKVYDDPSFYILKIDKTAPGIGDAYLEKAYNANGWLGESSYAVFTVSESANFSGIQSISVNPSVTFSINSGLGVHLTTNTCRLLIADYRVYTVTAVDIAGNVATREFRFQVDTTVPSLSLEAGTYTPDVWTNGTANFYLLASMGASGAKFYYKLGSQNFALIGTDTFLKEPGAATAPFQNVRQNLSLNTEMNAPLTLKVVTASGLETELAFGPVKIDHTLPEVVSITNMQAYQGATWLSTPILVDFYANDGASGVDIARVTVNNGGTVSQNGTTQNGYPRFTFQIDKCTNYTVKVYDVAGNLKEYVFWANVDLGVPEMTFEAYIGATAERYYFDKWINYTVYGENAFVRFVFDMNISPSGAKIQYMDSSNIWKDLTELLHEEGNENALEQHVVATVDVKTDQNSPFRIRLLTGSGKTTGIEELGIIMIDSTLPYFSSTPVFTNAANINEELPNFRTEWTNKVVKARFIPSDATSGIQSVGVMRYEIGDIGMQYGTPVECEKEAATVYYSFLMDRYASYSLLLTDGSGNSNYYPLITAMVDITDGLRLAVTATKDGQPFVSGVWMQDVNDIVEFDFAVTFAPGSGYTGFGASGGRIEFSVDGGATWQTELTLPDGTQSLIPAAGNPLSASMTVVLQQVKTYVFRARTGAGNMSQVSDAYEIRKDTVPPAMSYNARANGIAYAGAWTAYDIEFIFTVSVGASNGYIQVMTSDTQIGDPSLPAYEGQWVNAVAVTQGLGTQYTYRLSNTIEKIYYYFRVKAGTGNKAVAPNGTLVNLDKSTLTPTFAMYSGETLYTGGWIGTSLQARLDPIGTIPSGYTVYVGKAAIGSSTFVYDQTALSMQNGVYSYNLDSSGAGDIRFRIRTGAGVDFYTAPQTYRIDLIVPTFNILFNGADPKVFDPAQPNAVWYLTDVNVLFNSVNTGESGYTAQYAVNSNGTWGEWTSQGIVNNEVIFRDESISGGTVREIRFRLLSGAGRYDVKEYTLYIDDNIYSINVTQYVGSTQGLSYASNVSGIQDVQRGGLVTILFGNAEGYRIKRITVKHAYSAITGIDQETGGTPDLSGDYVCDYSEVNIGEAESITVEASGSDIEVNLYFIKYITLAYENYRQTLQNSEITPIDITVDEYNFYTTYAAETLEFEVLYNGKLQIPQDIGVYSVWVSSTNDNFQIVNPDVYFEDGMPYVLELTVRYFANSGDEFDPYIIGSYNDLTYLNYYMDTSEEYDYLGLQRVDAVFQIVEDIELPADFVPLCAGETNAFQGWLYGQNHKIYSTSVYHVDGDFGLFGRAIDAYIANLGIEMNIRAASASGNVCKIGMAAAEASTIYFANCYVYGSIVITGGGTYEAGGLVGKITSGIVGYCFSDVAITVTDALGSFGGIAGGVHAEPNSPNLFVACYYVGQISVDQYASGAVRGAGYHVGAYIGWLEQPFDIELIAQFESTTGTSAINNYLKGNIVVRSKTAARETVECLDIGIGNEGSIAYEYSVVRPYSFFLESEDNIGDITLPLDSGWDIRNLAGKRILEAGFGLARGVEASPFIVDTAEKLAMVAVFPWAYFEQSQDIVYPSGGGSISAKIPFAGIYDGKNHTILCSDLTVSGSYGGLFALVYGGTVKNLMVVGISIAMTATTDLYIGALAGYATGALISNVVVSGTVEIDAARHNAYVGGIVGVYSSSTMTDCVSMLTIKVQNASNAYAGGIMAQAQGATTITNVVSLSRISVDFSKNGYIGATIGFTYDQGVSGEKLYNVEDSTYVNGRLYNNSIGSNLGTVHEVYNRSYNDTVSAANGVTMGSKGILELISNLYPFAGGTGTVSDPFRIATYQQLLKIGNYMYANFKLVADIVIGDIDGDTNNNGIPDGQEPGGVRHPDGKVDALDAYDYSFKSIGRGVAFTGSLTGAKAGGGEYYISGLTAPLFEINNGTVNNLTLNVSYRQYASEADVPVGIQGYHVDASGADVVFGGLAKYNYANGRINSVTVAGSVYIAAAGKAKIKAGGIVGVMYGGTIRGSLNAVDMTLRSLLVDAGGIAGTLEGNAIIQESASGSYTLNYNYTVATIRADGGSVKAGLIVGAVRYQYVNLEVTEADTSARIIINGVDKGSSQLVGYSII